MTEKLFGTDGIRGTANKYPMTADVALKFATATGGFFKQEGRRNRVVIAKDCRLSGYLLEPALVAGFISTGMDVIQVGPMPTPAVPMLIKSLRADLGVMISASHNPSCDNGLKLFDKNGCKLSDDLQNKLQDMIINNHVERFLVEPDLLGRAKRLDDAQGRYIEHVKKVFPKNQSLEGLRIVVDCANGSAYRLAPTILWELGAEVIPIATEPNGFNINQNCGSMHPDLLAKKVMETRADIGIALDGDADRVVICDEKGETISGDHIIALIANYLHENKKLEGNAIISTQMSNSALESYVKSLGLGFHRTKVGDRYVFEKMQETGCNFGGEQSGHIILKEYSNTGDGIVAALHILAALTAHNCRMSELANIFTLNPQVTVNVRFTDNNPLENNKISSSIDDIKNKNKDMRILVRKSGTEPLIRIAVEGKEKITIDKVAMKLESLIKKAAI